MMYGTILSPVLILLGYDPKLLIPAILLSQALGGGIASLRHNKLKNARVFDPKGINMKIASMVGSLGVIATIIGAFVGASIIPKIFLKNYIGVLCIGMGLFVLSKKKFKFNWEKITALSLLGGFNKAMSGGGFGPIMSSGQIVSGRGPKDSIVTTDFAEVPICLTGFAVWIFINGWPKGNLIFLLSAGAMIGGYLGPIALNKFRDRKKLTTTVGILTFILGAATVFFGIKT
jgi:hypothetical protein